MSERVTPDEVGPFGPPAVVKPYDPAWPDTFQRLVARLHEGLTVEHVLDHVGSTAVPGLAANRSWTYGSAKQPLVEELTALARNSR